MWVLSMNKKRLLILSEITLIVILLIFCIVIEFRTLDFKKKCMDYPKDKCPCQSPPGYTSKLTVKGLNLSNLNFSNNLNN